MKLAKTSKKRVFTIAFLALFSMSILAGCGAKADNKSADTKAPAGKTRTIILGSYTVNKEPYEKELIPAFQKYWKQKSGEDVKFETSFVASGAQAKAIVGGFEADVAALSLEGDIDQIVKAGLITNNWKSKQADGFVTNSIAVIAVRPGNPKNIKDWEDLAKPGIGVLYPNPKTSGGAMWDVNAIYGAGLKISEQKNGKQDPAFAKELLKGIQKNVKVMDKSGRESFTTFEKGTGDAVVTYENEVLRAIAGGAKYDLIYPKSTILIQNPIAIVDKNVEKHGNKEVVEAFVNFLYTKDAQRILGKNGFRPVDQEVAKEFSANFPIPAQLFSIDYLGGWSKVVKEIYGADGVWTKIVVELGQG